MVILDNIFALIWEFLNNSITRISKIRNNTGIPHFIVACLAYILDTSVLQIKSLWQPYIRKFYPLQDSDLFTVTLDRRTGWN
jgi:hypothetical protein